MNLETRERYCAERELPRSINGDNSPKIGLRAREVKQDEAEAVLSWLMLRVGDEVDDSAMRASRETSQGLERWIPAAIFSGTTCLVLIAIYFKLTTGVFLISGAVVLGLGAATILFYYAATSPLGAVKKWSLYVASLLMGYEVYLLVQIFAQKYL